MIMNQPNSMQCYLFASIISADNERYTEEAKQEVISRQKEKPYDWGYVLQPLGKDECDKLTELFEELNPEI